MAFPTPRTALDQARDIAERVTLLERRQSSGGGAAPAGPGVYGSAYSPGQDVATGPSSSLVALTLDVASGVAFGSSRLTIVAPGMYMITAAARFSSSSSGLRSMYVGLATSGGSGSILGDTKPPLSGSGTSLSASGLRFLEAGDSLSLSVNQTSGVTLEVLSASLAIARVA